jgi:hypothetical protein
MASPDWRSSLGFSARLLAVTKMQVNVYIAVLGEPGTKLDPILWCKYPPCLRDNYSCTSYYSMPETLAAQLIPVLIKPVLEPLPTSHRTHHCPQPMLVVELH